MIAYPKNWRIVGQEVMPQDVEDKIEDVLIALDCKCLTLSGGIDSSLLLYFLCQFNNRLEVFTMGKSEEHPDIVSARKVAQYCRARFNVDIIHHVYCPMDKNRKEISTYELLYNFVGNHTDKIIAGDGVDEFMCGYYAHMEDPVEEIYHAYLRKLRDDHLIPLDLDSGALKVYLPYLDGEVIRLMLQIPLWDKVDREYRKRFMTRMASGKIPGEIIVRRKYGLCDALEIK